MNVNEIRHYGEMKYRGNTVIKYEIDEPVLENAAFAQRFNDYNNMLYLKLIEKIRNEIYPNAVKQYKIFIKKNDFMPLETKTSVDVMYQSEKYISLFIDCYYSKGAEGYSMSRFSQTWNLSSGRKIVINDLFMGAEWSSFLIQKLSLQVKKLENEMGVPCYPEWRSKIYESINNNRFYLTQDGIVIFVPQGHIASDIWGIPTFLIDYKHISNILTFVYD